VPRGENVPVPHRFIAARVRQLGLPLAGGLLILAVGLWSFAAIADEMADGETAFDESLADWLHAHATQPLTEFFEGATALGNGVVLAGVSAVAAYLLARRRRHAEALLIVLAFVGAEVLSYALKLGFRRDRPFFTDPLATETTFSFPSGHATVSLAVYGALAVVLSRHLRGRARLAPLAAAALLVSLIGFSRLYLGVHFLTDVLAGFSAGMAWLAFCVVALDLHERRRTRRQTVR
jgi:membrane-associated phospholipid phosphatase